MSSATNQTVANEELNDLIWTALKSNPQDMMFWSAMGLILAPLLLSSIWAMTIKYYELYGHKDHPALRIGVGVGTVMCTLIVGLECAMTYKLTPYAVSDYAKILRSDTYGISTLEILNGVFATPAYAFYSWRIYKSKDLYSAQQAKFVPRHLFVGRRFVPFVPLGILLQKTFDIPSLSIDNGPALQAHYAAVTKWTKAVTGSVAFTDCFTCICMIISLWRSKREYLKLGGSVFRRLVSLSLETMLPPSICVLIISLSLPHNGAINATFCRIFIYALPILYFHCLLASLLGRESVRRLLEVELVSDGVLKVSRGQGARAPRSAIRDYGGVTVTTESFMVDGQMYVMEGDMKRAEDC